MQYRITIAMNSQKSSFRTNQGDVPIRASVSLTSHPTIVIAQQHNLLRLREAYDKWV